MTQSSLIQFVDSRHGKCSVSVVTLEDGVAVALQLGEKPDVSMRLSGTAAVQLGRAILVGCWRKSRASPVAADWRNYRALLSPCGMCREQGRMLSATQGSQPDVLT